MHSICRDQKHKSRGCHNFLKWLCFYKYQPSTIITASFCANSRMKLKPQRNRMDHKFLKVLIKNCKGQATKQSRIFTKEDNFMGTFPEKWNFNGTATFLLVRLSGEHQQQFSARKRMNNLTSSNMADGEVHVWQKDTYVTLPSKKRRQSTSSSSSKLLKYGG